MSAEEADKTATTDANAGDEEEEWLYGGKWAPELLHVIQRCSYYVTNGIDE